MASKPTERIKLSKNSKISRFSEFGSPKNELIRLLQVTQYRLNNMKKSPEIWHHQTLKRWGFSVKEINQIGINI